MTIDTVMIFAAGFGTRMRPLTLDRPKPMVDVGGRPLIDYSLALAKEAGAENLMSNTHYLPDVIRPYLEKNGVHVIHETPDILDTGGGLKNALPLLGDTPIWTLNPDVIWRGPNPLTLALDAWDDDSMDALLVCVPPENAQGTASNGDFVIDTNQRISRGTGVIYAGAQIIRPKVVADFEADAFSLNVVWDHLIDQGRCFACIYPGDWCDVGHPDGIPLAEALLKGAADG